eukprot:CAMPEP_0119323250 /NCGR_PEP_ID=MMETSP1333-20130426/60388_1 /TAXON_ID=418940 /ORGANISM="Scyphosphaera apsteinii, Strain RCC1455" /LENGTH=377 /DNA_ID=CAMNT_0007330649 /DNA_START=66 /DNA_END=1199 /DNA_ORIENTATION=+
MYFARFLRRKVESDNRATAIAAKLALPDSVLVARKSITLSKTIGRGAFGTVFLATIEGKDGMAPTQCVAKQININSVQASDIPLLQTELKIWSEVDHPNCLRFLGVSLEPKEYLMMCEHMDGGTLSEAHEGYKRMQKPPHCLSDLVAQLKMIVDAMIYLHQRSIIHRDLKTANILLDANGTRLVVGDFGLARFCASDGEMTAETGSYRWMAPEVFRHETYDKACDVYSFAVVCWEMLTFRTPFEGLTPVEAAFAVALRGERPLIPQDSPADIEKMISSCWEQEAYKRPTFEQVSTTLDQLTVPAAEPPSPPPRMSSQTPKRTNLTLQLPRNSSKRKLAESTSEEPALKRPESISSGLTDLLNIRDSSNHGAPAMMIR